MIRDTSKKAYKDEVLPTIGQRQLAVLAALEELGGGTNSEVARHLGWTINRVTGRVFELRAQGRVHDVGKRFCSVTGRLAYVWAARPTQGVIEV